MADVVIAGGGLAAVRTVQGLRDLSFDGTILLVSEEHEPPYDRPPLSKGYLLGQADDEKIRLLSQDRLSALDVEMQLGTRAEGLDRAARRVALSDGKTVEYGKLVVATGARPNRISALDGLEGVIYLRTANDARALRDALSGRPRVGIVGGGFIGLEVASVARQLGCEVTVVELAAAPLAPVLGTELGRFVQEWHEEQGVAFRCGCGLVGARGARRVEELALADGSTLSVDVVVAGVGVTANVSWLEGAGLEIHRGLVVDDQGRTADPAVFGVGDATCRHVGGRCLPSGHWTAASEQAGLVASALVGKTLESFIQEGYFWSDQFDARLQFTGTVGPEPKLTMASGEMEERAFVALLEDDADEVTGVFAMNSPREFVRTSLGLGR
jgi:3-phenylpropionate/trans-cinnamate dioxygenase ferredoxin reductase component